MPIAAHKTVGPCRILTFLGYEINTETMELSIPEQKLVSYRATIRKFLNERYISLRETKSLIGKLLFVTNVITAGKIFLRRLINATIGRKHPASKIPLSTELKEDLLV